MSNSIVPISSVELQRALALRDLSDPTAGPHAMQLILSELTLGVSQKLRTALRIERPNPLVTVESNYDALLIPPGVATRETRYTRYVDEAHMLRSHTSAALPPLLQEYKAEQSPVDILLAVPGLVYRRDQIDRTHVGEPHQLDLWRLSSTGVLDSDDLLALMAAVADAVLPGADWRVIPAVHPYTVKGVQLEVKLAGNWLELGEGGLIHPRILENAGLAESYSGLAMGLGLDRALMLRKGLDDIRYLRSTAVTVVDQMKDLAPWRPVSQQPAAKRDLSISRTEPLDDELLGDLCREALAEDYSLLEEAMVASSATYEELPPAAHERLGMGPAQTNYLVSLTLRSLEHTLKAEEANKLRDRVYLALHQGLNRRELTSTAHKSA